MSDIAIIYSTAATREDAVTLGRTLVEERIVACANVVDGATSIYWWEGAVQQEGEAVLLLKTRSELVDRAMRRIRALHRYECPALVAWNPAAVSADYRAWILNQTVTPAEES
ncbi:MAG: divalent-cation tolerance protein CutA [Planctomycetaceae bacterium]|nr:divalent-cation tolerance protein CutA [Planctomycetaceae bacterium]